MNMNKIKEIDDLDTSIAIKEKEFINKADMKRTTKNKGGRPKKAENDKATEQIFVNLTKDEKIKVDSFAKDMGIATSSLVKVSLKKFGVL